MAAVAAAVFVAGAVAVILLFDGGDEAPPDEGQATDPSPLETVGGESGVRFELITAECGYEVVVTASTTVDPQNGEFCLARVDVRNRGDVPLTFDPSCQYLIDTAGRRYQQRLDVLPLDLDTAGFFEQELPPRTVARDIGLYYDVPKGTEEAEVEMHTTCDSPGLRLAVIGDAA